jgi:hypothetical protein
VGARRPMGVHRRPRVTNPGDMTTRPQERNETWGQNT